MRRADAVAEGDPLRVILWRGSLTAQVMARHEGPFGDPPEESVP